MEKVSASLFGAPLVGYITEHYLKVGNGGISPKMVSDHGSGSIGKGDGPFGSGGMTLPAESLARTLLVLGVVCWTLCICVWLLMLRHWGRRSLLPLQHTA